MYMRTESTQLSCSSFLSCILAIFIALLSVLGATAGAHRLWAHRSYSASLPLRVLLMICQTALGQVGKQRCVLLHQYALFHLKRHCSISFCATCLDGKRSSSGVPYTGCGRKNSPILEANNFKTKEDTEIVLLFMESTQNAVLEQCVLNKHNPSGGLEY